MLKMTAANFIKLYLSINIIVLSNAVNGQLSIDSLKHLLDKATADTNKVYLLYKLSDQYLIFDPDTSIQIARKAFVLSEKIGYKRGQTRSLIRIANILESIGDYGKSLEYHLASLKISEEINDKIGIAATYNNIARLHADQNDEQDNKDAIKWYFRSEKIFKELKDYINLFTVYLNIADLYEKIIRLDSAIYFQEEALALDVNNYFAGIGLVNLGYLRFKWNKDSVSFSEMRRGISFLNDEPIWLSEAYYKLAASFELNHEIDSSIFYAKKAAKILDLGLDFKILRNTADLLSRQFEKLGKYDSAYVYSKLTKFAETRLLEGDQEQKVKQLNLYWREKIRQQEIAEQETIGRVKRKHSLQMTLIAMFIVIFFIILIILSKIKINSRVIQILGILGLLLLFEFIMIILHPYIGDLTGHTPVYMLIGLVLVSSILGPLHHNLVHWTKQKLGHRPQTGH
jgi:tetratricopeptide (TPR) repeat protein